MDVSLFEWRQGADVWGADPDAFADRAKRALDQGYPSLAHEIAHEGARRHPGHFQLEYLLALALARSSAHPLAASKVERLLDELPAAHPLLAETFSLKGRLAKDRAMQARSEESRARLAWESMASYLKAYRLSGDVHPAINAASMSAIAGDAESSRVYARETITACEKRLKSTPDDYWVLASLGEAALLLGRTDDALHWYGAAMRSAVTDLGSVATMRRQVAFLKAHLSVDRAVTDLLGIPKIGAFVGHMIDQPGRPKPRFPGELEAAVKARIDDAVGRAGLEAAFCSAACGADILFIEAMIERGIDVHVLLPFARPDFVETSVSHAGPAWVERFEAALERATTVEFVTREGYLGDDVLFRYCAEVIGGKAALRARQLGGEPVLIALLEKRSAETIGGAKDTVLSWLRSGHATEIIDLSEVRAAISQEANDFGRGVKPVPQPPMARKQPRNPARSMRTMIFADVAGFSRLSEEMAPSFVLEYLTAMDATLRAQPVPPTVKNTWGDGLYLVYDEVLVAARVALALVETSERIDWAALDMPADTRIRVGMHLGPVFSGIDPIIGQPNYFGSHVTRAARIEPVAAPGTVLVSEQTACVLEFQDQDEFACDYVGVIPLAKDYGATPLYHLRRMAAAE
ncbi:MAG: TRAFs-binding domain-containing protein [Gammaproteobacteria bacterium]